MAVRVTLYLERRPHMSFTWRFVVSPDGSFWRTPNIDGRLDNVSDEQLAELIRLLPAGRVQDGEPARPACSRCGGNVLLNCLGALQLRGVLPTGFSMELCPDCDAGRPGARAFIRWYLDPDRDPSTLPRLFEDWEDETMAARGWARVPQPEAPVSPRVHPRLVPRGRG